MGVYVYNTHRDISCQENINVLVQWNQKKESFYFYSRNFPTHLLLRQPDSHLVKSSISPCIIWNQGYLIRCTFGFVKRIKRLFF